jgi:Protein of unknown function (DUF3892)
MRPSHLGLRNTSFAITLALPVPGELSIVQAPGRRNLGYGSEGNTMARHLRIHHIVTTDLPGPLCVGAICGLNPDGTHWTLTQDQAVSQIEGRVSAFYIEKAGGKRFDVVVAMDLGAKKYLKTIPDHDHSNELLFLPNCLHITHTCSSRALGARASG